MTSSISFNEVFKYLTIGSQKRPIVQATLSYNRNRVDFPMLIDSGADITTLPEDLMSILKVQETDVAPKVCQGVGGDAQVKILTRGFKIKVGQKEVECPVVFDPGFNDRNFGLLGREGVFSKIKLGIRESKSEIYIAHSG